ncbi:S1/P1 nuclease [Phenylobacterium sp.]|uniref:S1/P1 nuclease n=1 Tax=Phenylobacterium sp. TaxID=1871053 RepID=UPI002BCCB984|nr:S1/P1 nuclease [Phenylobacterium sp.]HLZ77136.1 S1/P1 nuclease [Phenylobacterium sp.]
MRKLTLVCALGFAACATGALAWHNQGHMMTAEVAWQHMTPGARCRAVSLLKSEPEYARGLQNPTGIDAGQALFVNAATWPDRIKAQGVKVNNAPMKNDGDDAAAAGVQKQVANNIGLDGWLHKYWHFADEAVPAVAGQKPPPINAIERIGTFSKALAAPATPTNIKAYDLVWLIHLVGDVHQPLHIAVQFGPNFTTPAKGNDAGGNDVVVTGAPGFKELHGFWDGAPGDSKVEAKELSISVAAADALPAPLAAKTSIKDAGVWASESHDYADKAAYVTPIVRGSQGPFALTPAYVANAQKIATAQVALGGVRLGNLLNAALTWPSSECAQAH